MTKFELQVMIDDVIESLKFLKAKQARYVFLDHWLSADYDRAIDGLQESIEQLEFDLANYEDYIQRQKNVKTN